MIFLDEAVVELTSGTGGAGALSFHKEKHVPRGGPDGADGGKGGNIVLVADTHKRTLYDFKLKNKFVAENGGTAVNNKKGRSGENIVIHLPVGTIVYNQETNEPIVDLVSPGISYTICKGGRGGHGNLHYVSSVRQAPNIAEKGEPGQTLLVRLELKLLADVGLVGLPNAGKSTLLSTISAAKPKIANYPFTTLSPNLGVTSINGETFVVADLPGLIEGASQGIGLGFQFLRHVERTKVLVHLVEATPMDESDPYENYLLIEKEVKTYSEKLYNKPRIVVISKSDTLPKTEMDELIARFESHNIDLQPLSSATGQGVQPLLYKIIQTLNEYEQEEEQSIIPLALQSSKTEDDHWEVTKESEDEYRLTGKRILRMVAMTNLDRYETLRYLHRRLQGIGVIDKLKEAGAKEGDTVYVGDHIFSFTEEL